jgi:SAM-dependent methyltransferase
VQGPDTELISSQRTFYDLRAPDYRDESRPPDRPFAGNMRPETARTIVDALRPEGEVLELACGNGFFTRALLRHASSLTAVDSSQAMLD